MIIITFSPLLNFKPSFFSHLFSVFQEYLLSAYPHFQYITQTTMSLSTDLVFQLRGTCNNYNWGKKGDESLAARLCSQTPGGGFTIEADKHYSEMWFGDYPNFPGRVFRTDELLADRIENKPALLGQRVIRDYHGHLPFLPKASPLLQFAFPLVTISLG
jgi:hypothetical protein